jgi:hypothetical protein
LGSWPAVVSSAKDEVRATLTGWVNDFVSIKKKIPSVSIPSVSDSLVVFAPLFAIFGEGDGLRATPTTSLIHFPSLKIEKLSKTRVQKTR